MVQSRICTGNSLAAFLSPGEKDCALVHKSGFARRGHGSAASTTGSTPGTRPTGSRSGESPTTSSLSSRSGRRRTRCLHARRATESWSKPSWSESAPTARPVSRRAVIAGVGALAVVGVGAWLASLLGGLAGSGALTPRPGRSPPTTRGTRTPPRVSSPTARRAGCFPLRVRIPNSGALPEGAAPGGWSPSSPRHPRPSARGSRVWLTPMGGASATWTRRARGNRSPVLLRWELLRGPRCRQGRVRALRVRRCERGFGDRACVF